MRPGTPQFVAARLIEAREARDLTATALADLVGVTGSAISQYENGRQTPSPENLWRLAQALQVPMDRFLRKTPPSPPDTFFWRSMSSSIKSARTRAVRRYGWLREIVALVHERVELPAVNFPRFDAPSDPAAITQRDIEQFAEQTRRYWGLGDLPISNVAWLLENNGAIVVRHDLGTTDLDAFSVWSEADDTPYFVLGSDKESAARSRFDCGHELGHMVMHRGLADLYIRKTDTFKQLENQADRFAGAFLLPAATFGADLCDTTLGAFESLKSKWRVSIGAMISRAWDLGLISEEQKKRLWISYGRKGWRTNEPLDGTLPVEEPRMLRQAFKLMLENRMITADEVESSVSLKVRDAESLVGLKAGFLGDAEIVSLKFPSAPPPTDPSPDEQPPLLFRLPADRRA